MNNPQPSYNLTDDDRKAIHDFALEARAILIKEAGELLEGVYGLHADGSFEQQQNLPTLNDSERAETYRQLRIFLDEEDKAGLAPADAVEKLVKEIAFTHLNRLLAFKMMETRKLIRETVGRGPESNGFKFFLADPEHQTHLRDYEGGKTDDAYKAFLHWQSSQIAAELRVLFDPLALVTRLFPRPKILGRIIEALNEELPSSIWAADETIGWVYQYFNEPDLQAAFAKLKISGAKFEAKDIPAATQLFTPQWIVKYLVHNTLGSLWVRMHPDTNLLKGTALEYFIPKVDENTEGAVLLARDITLLDPACGGMHFGVVAFDLFYEMYSEEIERAGEKGWPTHPSVAQLQDIPGAIIENNIFGIDIDIRALQLSALTLYLKAKSKNPSISIKRSNLACAEVLPIDGSNLGEFLSQQRFNRPVLERILRALWDRLQDSQQLGSLLRVEEDIISLIASEREHYSQEPLFAGIKGEYEAEVIDDTYWQGLFNEIIDALHAFVGQQMISTSSQSIFVNEVEKGLKLLELLVRRYDVVVTNPPYMNRRKMNKALADLVSASYPEGKSDLFAAFIQRCLELANDHGLVGMLTMHSFMFISSYEGLRAQIREKSRVETMAHCGPGLFDVGNPGTLQTAAFTLGKEPTKQVREEGIGTYFRLVHAPNGDGKRQVFEEALQALRQQEIEFVHPGSKLHG